MSTGIVGRADEAKVYGSSALRAAKYFAWVRADANLLRAADALQEECPDPALAVLAPDGAVVGILRRDRLFALLGKPFGREVLGRSLVAELAERVPSFDSRSDLFAVAERMLPRRGQASGAGDYCVI